MSKFTYGKWGEKHPVQPNDVWEVGPHLLGCGDIEKGAFPVLCKKYGIEPTMAYTDLPYRGQDATAFRTKAGVPRKVNWATFLQRIARSYQVTIIGDIYLEIAVTTIKDLHYAMQHRGATLGETWDIVWGDKKPCKLLRCSYSTLKDIEDYDLTGIDEEETPAHSIELSSDLSDWVADICMGRGLTAISADTLNRRAVGLELHPNRMSYALERLATQGGYTPRKTGVIH